MLTATQPQVPDALEGLQPASGESLQYPVSETVVETQPTLLWSQFAAVYSVTVSDTSGAVIARAEGLTAPQWRVPRLLTRGGIFQLDRER